MGGVTRIEYTPAGRVRRAIEPSGRAEAFEYDRCGRLAARIDGAGRRAGVSLRRRWRLVAGVAPDGTAERFRYDAAGRLVEHSVPGGGVDPLRLRRRGPRGRDLRPRRRHAPLQLRHGRAARRARSDAIGGVTRYGYHARGRLTEVIDPLGGRHLARV